MFLNKAEGFSHELNVRAQNPHRHTRYITPLLLSLLMLSNTSALAESNKYYLAVEHSIPTGNKDLAITSIGMLSRKDNIVSALKLSHLDSDKNGAGITLDLAGGYGLNDSISPYLLLGASLGYNWDQEDTIAAIYPEAGIVIEFTKTLGITASVKRYFNLYEEDEGLVMLGLVFRK